MIVATVVGFESMSTRNNVNSRSTFGTDIRIGNDTADYEQQEPEIEVAGNGNIYVVWEDIREGNWDIFFSRSITGGINWKDNLPVLDNNPTGSYQRDPTLAIDPNNFLYLAYEENRNGDWDIYFTRSSDNGDTWSTQAPVHDILDPGNTMQFNPSIAVDNLNNIYVAWTANTTTSWDVYISKSTDMGATWSEQVKVNDDIGSLEPEPPSPSIDIDGKHNVYVVWEDKREGTNDIYFSFSNNSGQSFKPDVKVNEGLRSGSKTVTTKNPQLKVNYRGDIYIVWDEEWNSLYNVYFSKSLDHGSSFDDDVRVNNVVDKCYPGPAPSLDLDDIGNIYVTWIDGSNDNHTYFAGSTNGGLSFIDNSEVDDTDETPVPKAPQLTYSQLEKAQPDIAVSSDGSEIYIVWSDYRNDQLPANELSENSDIYFDKTSTYGDRIPSSPVLNYNNVGSTYLELSWSINTDPDFLAYLLYSSDHEDFDISSKTFVDSVSERSSTIYNITGLEPTTTYYYKIRVQDTNGNWNDSNELKVTTIINEPPLIALVEPDGVNDLADTIYYIRWIDGDSDDNATITLFYDTNAIDGGEKFIGIVPQGEDGINNFYLWNTSNVSNGEYFVKAEIVDSVNQIYSTYSSGRLKIHHGELVPPEIVVTKPIDEAENVSVTTEMHVVFNEPIDNLTITDSNFYLTDSSMNNVDGILSYDNTSNKAVFTPVTNLDYNETYTATVTVGIRDLVGNALVEGQTWTFTTELKIIKKSVIQGRVLDKNSGDIISGANINFKGVSPDDHEIETGVKYSTQSGPTGNYELEVLYGVYSVTIIADDYQTLEGYILNLSTNLKSENFYLTSPVITEFSWEDDDGDGTVDVDEEVVFNAEGFDYENDTLLFVWNFGDGSTNEQGERVTHKFSDSGDYEITLTVTDLNGGQTINTTSIKVEEEDYGIEIIGVFLIIAILIVIIVAIVFYVRKLKKDRQAREVEAFEEAGERVPLLDEEEEEETDILASEEEEEELPPVKHKRKPKRKARKSVKKAKKKKKKITKVAKKKAKK
jgi:hypothetical protein